MLGVIYLNGFMETKNFDKELQEAIEKLSREGLRRQYAEPCAPIVPSNPSDMVAEFQQAFREGEKMAKHLYNSDDHQWLYEWESKSLKQNS